MTTAAEIITAAYRETNLVALVATPSTNEVTEGLARLNSIILSTIGNEAGSELRDLNIGGAFDQSFRLNQWVPADARLICNLGAGRSLALHPEPYEGQRLAVADASANFATHNLTLTGNGRTIEGVASLALNTNGLNRQWLYRADTANWVKISSLASLDTMPLPAEFDDYFIVSLALRLNPRHSAKTTQESMLALDRQRQQIRARYRRPRPVQDLGTYGFMGQRMSGVEGVFNPLLP